MKRIIALLLTICILASLFSGCSFFGKKKLTIMMYVVGSDLESEGGCASADFQEIMNSKLNLNQVDFLIYTGGAKSWKQNISSRINTVYRLTEKMGKKSMEQVSQTSTAADMGDPAQLSAFLNFGYENYPAEQYALICWDHGGGPNQGFGYDENHKDFLEISEFSAAFENSPFKGDNKLSWIGFDACLMGSIEIGDALKNYANFMIASEELEPGTGWDYSFLSLIGGNYSPQGTARACIDTFNNYEPVSALTGYGSYMLPEELTIKSPITLSCVDLQKIDPLNQAVNNLFTAMDNSLQQGKLQPLVNSRGSLYAFGQTTSTISGTELDLVDIGQLASVCTDFPQEAQAVQNALNDYIVYHQSNIDDTTGASIYYPYTGVYTFMVLGGDEAYTRYASSPGYVKYISDFTDQYYKGVKKQDKTVTRSTTALSGAQADKDKITVTLTADQKKTFSRAYVNVLEKLSDELNSSNNDYVGLLLDYQVDPDADGNISIDADLSVPVHTLGTEKNFWPMRQTSSSGGKSFYQSLRTLVVAAPEEMPYTAWEHVSFNAVQTADSDDLAVFNVSYADDTGYSLGKNDVDLDHWNYFDNNTIARMKKYNADGSLSPFSEWETNGVLLMRDSPIDDESVIRMTPLSECGYGDYYYQVVIEDVNGNRQASDLFSFTQGEKYEEVVEKTPSGELTYRVFSDHVEADKYNGTDNKLVIPEKYKELPVTVIGREFMSTDSQVREIEVNNPDTRLEFRAFYSAHAKKITFPEGMTEVGDHAFSYSYFEEIVLPSTVEKIGRRAFARCYSLESLTLPAGLKEIGIGAFAGLEKSNNISFAGDNANYKIENDFLLSKDGKILYSRFTESNECVVPDGVEEIASWSCMGAKVRLDSEINSIGVDNRVTSVKLSDSVRIIHSDAFRDSYLTELTIPDSVQYLGHNAFANYELEYSDPSMAFPGEEPPEHVAVTIGSGLSWIGKEVFGANSPRSVEVSEENEYFSAADGKLMNKAGDREIELAALSEYDLKREAEYKTLEYLRTQLDMSNYKPSGSDEYSYEGNSYSQTYYPNDKTDPGWKPELTLGDKQITMPCTVQDILDAGFKYNNPADADKKLSAETGSNYAGIHFEDANGKKFETFVTNPTDKEISVADAAVQTITVKCENGVDYLSNGLTCAMDIKSVVKKYPNPQVYLSHSNDKDTLLSLVYESDVESNEKASIEITITLAYLYNYETGELTPYSDTFAYRTYTFSS